MPEPIETKADRAFDEAAPTAAAYAFAAMQWILLEVPCSDHCEVGLICDQLTDAIVAECRMEAQSHEMSDFD